MSIEGQCHFFTVYFPGFVCFVLYLAKISGERLQDHWSSGFQFTYVFLHAHFDGVKRKFCVIKDAFTMFCIRIRSRNKLYYSKKVLHHQIFTKIYKYHFFLSTPILSFKFDTALEDSIQYLTQQ